jgi:hypothetical protein
MQPFTHLVADALGAACDAAHCASLMKPLMVCADWAESTEAEIAKIDAAARFLMDMRRLLIDLHRFDLTTGPWRQSKSSTKNLFLCEKWDRQELTAS